MPTTTAAPALTVKSDATALRLTGDDGQAVTLTGTAAVLRAELVRALAMLDERAEAAVWAAVKAQQTYPCR